MTGKVRIVLDYNGDGSVMWVTERDVDFSAGDSEHWVSHVVHDTESVFDAAAGMFQVPCKKWVEVSRGERVES